MNLKNIPRKAILRNKKYRFEYSLGSYSTDTKYVNLIIIIIRLLNHDSVDDSDNHGLM